MATGKRRRGRPLTEELSVPQRETHKAILDYLDRNGRGPTFKELAIARGVVVGTIQDHVKQLENKGYIQRTEGVHRGITILKGLNNELVGLKEIPIIGNVAAGIPIFASQNVVGKLMVESSQARGNCFALRVKGDSMTKAKIRDGDLVIVRQQPTAEHRDIVVALIDNEATVKRLSYSDHQVRLLPENSRYRPITIGPDLDVRIVGKVIGVRANEN